MWWELALNPRVVTAYYTSPPELSGVEVHSVQFHRDGPTLELVVELPRFPDRPSPRWAAEANTAQAGLRFFDLQDVSLTGWGTTNIGDLSIERTDSGVRFSFTCPTAQITGVAGYFDVTSVSAYVKGS